MSATIIPIAPNEIQNNWLRQPSTDRPIYECRKCGERAMQFFLVLPESSQFAERTNSFVCFACGCSWEM
jgi:DNA-directed RNA polymerase subunit M/transcription elongation factor TFIIS